MERIAMLALSVASAVASALASAVVLAAASAAPAPAAEAVPPSGATLRVGVPAGPDAVAGFDRGLFAEAAREAGLGVVFEVMAPEAALAALDAGRIDVAAGPHPAGRAPALAPGRRALAPTLPVAPAGDALLKRRGDGSLKAPGDAAGKVLGLLGPSPASIPASIPASAAARLRAEAAALGARVAAAPRAFADPLGALSAGRVAALVGGLADVADAALARPDAFEVVGPLPVRGAPPAAPAALARADRPDLAGRLDAALGRMRADGRLAEVQRRWFGFALDPPAAQPSAASASSASSATAKP